MVLTDAAGRVLFCSPVRRGSCADTTQARQLGLVQLLADGPFVEILADADYQGLGAQPDGRVCEPGELGRLRRGRHRPTASSRRTDFHVPRPTVHEVVRRAGQPP
ncbi:hypothetical protein ACFTY8_12105 [Streptomyces mirabilis]|uniref:hypothetical protein n=1 Tax=Streptomyces mirabilis TaxID=68239 RepID=UPI00362E1AB2